MVRPRRIGIRTPEQLWSLTEARLLAYRRKALQLINSPDEADYGDEWLRPGDQRHIYYKSDPRWEVLYRDILEALARVQSSYDSK
jgi:hypothetical protein